jgi:hypothetical protein
MYPTSDKTKLARELHDSKTKEALKTKRHNEQLLKLSQVERSMVSAIQQLVRFLDGKTTKTEVINQLKSISTPDVDKVVTALKGLDQTVVKNKVDLSPLEKVLTSILNEQKKSLKEIKFPEQKDTVKVSNLKELDLTPFVEAVKSLKFEAPKVDVKVPQTKINVEKPDLKPLQSTLLQIVTTLERQKFPEPIKTDLTKVEDELKDSNKKLDQANKHLEEITKIRSSGGGGGSGTSFKNSSGNLTYVQINPDGSIPTNSPAQASRLDDSNDPILYIGKAPVGSDESDPVWQIAKLDTSSGLIKTWASTAQFNQVWNDRTTLTYA